MKRGEVWRVNFDPSVGGEIRKKRPAVIADPMPRRKPIAAAQGAFSDRFPNIADWVQEHGWVEIGRDGRADGASDAY